MTRRRFFPALARWAALGALAALAAASVKGRRSRRLRQYCVRRGICRGCGVFDRCGLPAALSAKQHRKEP